MKQPVLWTFRSGTKTCDQHNTSQLHNTLLRVCCSSFCTAYFFEHHGTTISQSVCHCLQFGSQHMVLQCIAMYCTPKIGSMSHMSSHKKMTRIDFVPVVPVVPTVPLPTLCWDHLSSSFERAPHGLFQGCQHHGIYGITFPKHPKASESYIWMTLESSNLNLFITFCLKSVENPSKIGFINGYYIHCEMWGHAWMFLRRSTAVPGYSVSTWCRWCPARCWTVTLLEPYLLEHFHWKLMETCIPKGSSHIGRTGHISKCLGNGSTYVLSSSPYRRDVQGKTNGVNQKTHKMSHVLYHLPNFTMGGAQKTQEPLHV